MINPKSNDYMLVMMRSRSTNMCRKYEWFAQRNLIVSMPNAKREDFVGDLYFDAGFAGSILKKERITLQAAFKPGERINMLITSAPGLVSPKGL